MVIEITPTAFVIIIASCSALVWTLVLIVILFCIEQSIVRQMVKDETKKMWDKLRRTVHMSMTEDNASSDIVVWNPNDDLDIVTNY